VAARVSLRLRVRAPASGILVLGLIVGIVAAGCGAAADLPTFPSTSIGPDRTVSPAVATTAAELTRILGERRLIVTEPQQPYRPAEALTLSTAPRAVFQVTLPDDPDGGWVVVYELADGDAATAAAEEQAAWLASGPGRVQTPIGTVHVLRVVGSTVVMYSWHPDDAPDPGAAEIQAALETLGAGVDVPR
jgi:hypothetical protein